MVKEACPKTVKLVELTDYRICSEGRRVPDFSDSRDRRSRQWTKLFRPVIWTSQRCAVVLLQPSHPYCKGKIRNQTRGRTQSIQNPRNYKRSSSCRHCWGKILYAEIFLKYSANSGRSEKSTDSDVLTTEKRPLNNKRVINAPWLQARILLDRGIQRMGRPGSERDNCWKCCCVLNCE